MNETREDNFYKFLEEAISMLPEVFKDHLKNVAIFVKDYPDKKVSDGLLLGLYEGVPNTFKNSLGYSFLLPDKISLFRKNIEKMALIKNIAISKVIREVLYHEIGHHLGFSEEDLRNLSSL